MKRYEFYARVSVLADSPSEAEAEAEDLARTISKADGFLFSIQLDPPVEPKLHWFEPYEEPRED
jgi:hypothetical protein